MTAILDERLQFPDPRQGTAYGLVAKGGDLSPQRLLLAYAQGIYPWFAEWQPIRWFCPNPRFVLWPNKLYVSASMRSLLRREPFRLTLDTAFGEVIRACAGNSAGRSPGVTWITPSMIEAYTELHRLGYAHSVEVWDGEALVGGLYGVSLGRVFFGESMFTYVSNASKYGFIRLIRLLEREGFDLIDCQQGTDHLISLGAEAMTRDAFLDLLERQDPATTRCGSWSDMSI
jgi:leucyl/phenylalanyl-tRNA--protein transferase